MLCTIAMELMAYRTYRHRVVGRCLKPECIAGAKFVVYKVFCFDDMYHILE